MSDKYDKEFDDILREKLSGFSEEVPDIWGGIESGLERKRRWTVVRRVSYAAVAAAACLVGGLFLFRGGEPAGEAAPVQVAEVRSSDVKQDEVAPIGQQIENFVKSDAVAQAKVASKPVVREEKAVSEPQAQETATVAQPVAEPATEPQPVQSAQPAKEPADSHYLTQDDLPAGFWDEEEPSHKDTHTSLSILSNLSAGASDEALSRIYKGNAPMHTASQTGKGSAPSGVVPISNSPSFDMPLAVGVQAKIPVGKGFSAGIGLDMTYLVSQYDALVNSVYHSGVYNQLWYVGVPVNLYYNFIDTPKFGAYASVGGAAEKCVYQRYVFGSEVLSEKVDGIQYSADFGLGLEYWFAPKMGIYVDPSVVYYFDNRQPLSIRTQQPFQMRFEVGLRFKL